jgi:preprotein translocase subunit SecD
MSVVLRTRPLYVEEEEEEVVVSNRNWLGRAWDSVSDWTVGLFTPDEQPVQTYESDIDRALEILNNRIDKLGLVEPQIRKMNEDQILVEIPGEEDPERVRAFLQGKSTLGFYIIDEDASARVQQYLASGGQIIDDRPAMGGIIGPDQLVFGFYQKDLYGVDQFIQYFAVDAEPILDGRYIQNATTYPDPMTGRPNVSFYVSSERIVRDGVEDTVQYFFGDATGKNVDRFLAVALDGRIRAYARIKERLTSAVRITGFDAREADDLALILRTEAMPVELEMESYQAVNATLGEETIDAGLMAFLIGFAAVIVFMLLYYKGSGIIADIALLLNLILVSSVLSALNLTLTMTSIAGIILNIGMAVDANVIIFERIKEEIRLGKSRAAAVDAGFKKAFWTVMDANITTFIAAIFLSLVGKGPVQGFAVTLAVGIICSMFTALFVSRLMFDFTTDVLKRQKVSIGWGLYR